MRSSLPFSVAAILLLSPPSALFARIWSITPDGTGDAPTIQAAIDLAVDGDRVRLAPGTYTGSGNRDLDFGGKAIVIKSSHGADVTIIDCEDAGDGFLLQSNEDQSSVISGLTIKRAGIAVWCRIASPMITDCVLTMNNLGIKVSDDCDDLPNPFLRSEPEVTNSTISSNVGGVLVLECGYPQMNHCVLCENRVGLNGAARMTDCSIASNNYGVFTYPYRGGLAVIEDCVFNENGLAITDILGNPTIRGCTFFNNGSLEPDGGAIKSFSDRAQIEDNVFVANTAPGNGGAIFWFSGTSLQTRPVITGNTFIENAAGGSGGAIYLEDSAVDIVANTFSENSSALGAGAIHFDNSFSSDGDVNRNIIAFSIQGLGMACTNGATPTLSCNDVFGNAGGDALCGIDGGGNFSLDPQFCGGLGERNVGLRGTSPCLGRRSPCGLLVGARNVGCGPPLKFTQVGAAVIDGGVDLNWSVVTDVALEGFAVLRRDHAGAEAVRIAGPPELAGGARNFTDTAILSDQSPTYIIVAIATDKSEYRSQPTGVIGSGAAELLQNYPNPFNPVTTITYVLERPSTVDLAVYDVSGRRVATLEQGVRPAGRHSAVWSVADGAGRVSSGVYFYQLTVGDRVLRKKMVLLK